MPISIEPDEIEPIRTVMRDLQLGAARYYAQTATGGELGATVRSFIGNAQILNDWFTKAIVDSASYAALFQQPRHAGADIVDAIKYVRNVSQHVLHVVKPGDTRTLVGGVFGYRSYAYWEAIPIDVHAKLQPRTQGLRPAYEAKLKGRELMSTMMAVLRFYAEIAPSMVHRDQRGEWTGFPLMSQPGMSSPLHPEEPRDDVAKARAWMSGRRPGGDARVICGRVTIDEVQYVYGYTFVGQLSFAPFHETVAQINQDIALGFSYFEGDLLANASDVSDKHPDALQGHVVGSRESLASWATPVRRVEPDDDWCLLGLDPESWSTESRLELPGLLGDQMAYGVRRARRLNALVPPRGI